MPDKEKPPPLEPNLPPLLREAPRNPRYQDDASEEQLPTLLMFLQTTFDQWGRVNWEGARLTVRLRAGSVHVSLTCPTSKQMTSFEVMSLLDLPAEVEEKLRSGKLTWEEDFDAKKESKKALDAARRKM